MRQNLAYTLFLYSVVFITFISGIFVCLSPSITKKNLLQFLNTTNSTKETFENRNNPECPDLLLKKDGKLMLIHSKLPKSETNPVFFSNLDEYSSYVETQRSKGIRCPILFLQEEENTQGNSVYRMREGPTNMDLGRQVVNVSTPQTNTVVKIQDASRSGIKFNKDMYPGFDSHGTYIGKYTTLDQIHDSTKFHTLSENPMDSNWGGVRYSQDIIDSGKHKDREVGKQTMVPKVLP